MFGESESESPRVPSPWDHVLAAYHATAKRVYCSDDVSLMPKLSAEIEEGNIEYKLHLLHPSPARFVRLVTQLKWRLLEGGGQALYELGVADSGELIGLSPDNLTDTLTTLRAMAAEIGAHVQVVRQVEVIGMGVREQDALEFARKRRDRTCEKDRAVFKAKLKIEDAAFSQCTGPIIADKNDGSGVTTPGLDTSPWASPSPPTLAIPTPNDVPSIQTPVALDEAFALFTLDAELDAPPDGPIVPPDKDADVSVYSLPSSPVVFPELVHSTITFSGSVPLPTLGAARRMTKAERRRITRDHRRVERKKAIEQGDISAAGDLELAEPSSLPGLETAEPASVEFLVEGLAALGIEAAQRCEPRMIVEALVFRELDEDEAFLDFSRL